MADATQHMTSVAQRSSILRQVWQQLQGTWHLNRKLHSTNAAEPSGNCKGVAVFTTRQPAVFVDADDVLQNASEEMLYSEQGDFEMTATAGATNLPRFSFSRKYVWRLQDDKTTSPEISIWFVKPGTDKVDYLFHKVLLQHLTSSGGDGQGDTSIECSGGHLCVEDYYSSIYTFEVGHDDEESAILKSWNMLHEVTGPKKDQVIETTFTRA